MKIVLIANAISLAGCGLMVLIGLIKTKRNILLAQNLQFAILAVANFLLGGITGAVSNVVSIVRNLICLKWELTLPLKIVFIAAQGFFTAISNTQGLIGWLPFIAVTPYTLILDSDNPILIKSVLAGAQVLWLIYDIIIKNFSGSVFDAMTVISTIYCIIMMLKKGDKKEEVEKNS